MNKFFHSVYDKVAVAVIGVGLALGVLLAWSFGLIMASLPVILGIIVYVHFFS